MRFLLILLSVLLLTGCAAPAPVETTVPETIPVFVPATETVPETTVPPAPEDLLLTAMTLEQKVGQLFIVAPEQLLPGSGAITSMTDALETALARYHIGGVILFGNNIQNPKQLSAFTNALSDVSPTGLFLAVDEEGGLVARLAKNESFGLPRYKSAASVGASGNSEDALAMGRTIGAYLCEYGFNLDFAPVADVNTNPRNPIIGTRAFSSNPETAAHMAAAFAQGLTENGVIATFKHFPGHGDTAEDSHEGIAVLHKSREELASGEWLPFLRARETDMVMVGHIAVPEITGDLTPATLSRQLVTEILKAKLGFRGLVVTDAMNMGAILNNRSCGAATVEALAAGCDLILMPENLEEAFAAVLTALEDGTLTQEWLDETVRRIIQFKLSHGIVVCD